MHRLTFEVFMDIDSGASALCVCNEPGLNISLPQISQVVLIVPSELTSTVALTTQLP